MLRKRKTQSFTFGWSVTGLLLVLVVSKDTTFTLLHFTFCVKNAKVVHSNFLQDTRSVRIATKVTCACRDKQTTCQTERNSRCGRDLSGTQLSGRAGAHARPRIPASGFRKDVSETRTRMCVTLQSRDVEQHQRALLPLYFSFHFLCSSFFSVLFFLFSIFFNWAYILASWQSYCSHLAHLERN